MCNSTCKCECNCKCVPPCDQNTICICLCKCTKPKSTKCCICICNHKDCKCICICICENDKNCCCETSQTHECKKSLVKINLSILKIQTCRILNLLRWIRCCMSKPEGNCCSCPCSEDGCSTSSGCFSYCCCKEGTIKYSSIVLKLYSTEFLFKELSNKICKLLKFKNILSSKSSNGKPCVHCPNGCCKDKVEKLIDYSSKACQLYSSLESRIKETRSLIQNKVFYSKSEEISSLQKSIKCLLQTKANMINGIVTRNSTNTPREVKVLSSNTLNEIKKVTFVNILSRISIHDSIFVMSRLYMYYKTKSEIFQIFLNYQNCQCINHFYKSFINTGLYKKVMKRSFNTNVSNEYYLHKDIENTENHICLCLVMKYVLLTDIYVINNYNDYIYYDILSWISRKHKKYTYLKIDTSISKLIILTISVIYKITLRIRNIYGENTNCFCKNENKIYYNYLISIILWVSSLIKRIWTMDNDSIGVATKYLSILLSDYHSIRFYTNFYLPRSRIYSLIINKKCKKPCKPNCCCWCKTCANLLMACISLCVQFTFYKVYKSLCKKTNGCEKLKEICTIEELQCKCECQEGKKRLCCLLKLALCSQLPKSCEELLKNCCEQCQTQEESCCKKILKMLSSGGDLLGITCNCKCASEKGTEVKAQCVLFKNPWGGRSEAILILCKCKDTTNCCCFSKGLDKCKQLFSEIFKKGCELNTCCCDKLKECYDKLCCDENCGQKCPCKNVKDLLPKICGDSGSNCLCKEIGKLKDLCKSDTCKCKDQACCRCVCWKLLVAGVRVLTKACRQNFLNPYKNAVVQLFRYSKNKRGIMRSIVNSINNRTLNITYLLKNNYSTHFNTYRDHKNIANRFPRPTMGYGYDSVYEHQEASNSGYTGTNSIRKGYLNIGCGRIIKRNKMYRRRGQMSTHYHYVHTRLKN